MAEIIPNHEKKNIEEKIVYIPRTAIEYFSDSHTIPMENFMFKFKYTKNYR